MKELTLNGRKLKLSFNGASQFRFSEQGGNADEMQGVLMGDSQAKARGFFNMVLFIWSMLEDESRREYPTPQKFAMICLPPPSEVFQSELVTFLNEEKKRIESEATQSTENTPTV